MRAINSYYGVPFVFNKIFCHLPQVELLPLPFGDIELKRIVLAQVKGRFSSAGTRVGQERT